MAYKYVHAALKQTDQRKGLLASQAFQVQHSSQPASLALQTLNMKDAHDMLQGAMCVPSYASAGFFSAQP